MISFLTTKNFKNLKSGILILKNWKKISLPVHVLTEFSHDVIISLKFWKFLRNFEFKSEIKADE